jgi:hypothetical protein
MLALIVEAMRTPVLPSPHNYITTSSHHHDEEEWRRREKTTSD